VAGVDEQIERVRRLDSAVQVLRHGRFGLYGPLIRERFLAGLPGGVTPVGYRVLRFVEVSSPPPPTLSDVAAVLLVDRARAVRVVDRLVADGLVERVRDDVDQRVRRVALTGKARRHLGEAAARRAELLGAVLDGWPAEDLERLTGLLDRLNDSVVRHLPG
jgi:DNA-binding MarR family transcriptional regulator